MVAGFRGLWKLAAWQWYCMILVWIWIRCSFTGDHRRTIECNARRPCAGPNKPARKINTSRVTTTRVVLVLVLVELRYYIQLSGVIAAEWSLRSTQLPGFSNQGFKTFHTIH